MEILRFPLWANVLLTIEVTRYSRIREEGGAQVVPLIEEARRHTTPNLRQWSLTRSGVFVGLQTRHRWQNALETRSPEPCAMSLPR
jgi:hypothetical protein